jgi:glutathione S-transferase
MSDLTLFFAPDTCARVSMIALEETGRPYKTELIAFMRGDHRSPRYLALNPKGRVPTLTVDGRVLTENVAILLWLAGRFPEANLLPQHEDAFDRAQVVADLTYCASQLHPIVTRLRFPQYFCDIPGGAARVFEMAELAMRPNFAVIDRRLAEREWWHGDRWSVMDAYINWIWFRVTGAGFDGSEYPHFAHHDERIKQRPSVQRALRRNSEAAAQLDARGLAVKYGGAAP